MKEKTPEVEIISRGTRTEVFVNGEKLDGSIVKLELEIALNKLLNGFSYAE